MVPGEHERGAEEAPEQGTPEVEAEPVEAGPAGGAPPAESSPSRILPGFPRIDGYRVEGYLGRGATGVVYSAVQLAVDRPVALKVLHPELIGSKRAVRRLQREARTAARLAHPSIISAIDMGETDGRWWYAMELVEGISIAERVQERGPLTEREMLRMFIPLCDALQHAYHGGVVHRDIKPGNILIDMHGRARLVDLGLAFAEDDPMITSPGGTLGTPHFISPEQAVDPTKADVRSDIWSLGATMFHTLTGRPPFEGPSVAEILSGVLHERIPDPRQLRPELSRGMALVLRKCLTRAPERRYQEPAQLMRDLERIRERRSPEVSASSLDPMRPAPGERAWSADSAGARVAAGVLAALAVLVAGWALWAKPWREGATEVRGGWPAFDQLAARFAAGEVSHARALREVASLETSRAAPAGHEAAPDELRIRIGAALAATVGEVCADLELEFEESLESRDFTAARTLLTRGLNRELLESTGFAAPAGLPDPTLARGLETWRAARREQLGRVRAAAVDGATRTFVRHYSESVSRPFHQLLNANRWRSAREKLNGDRRVWLAESGANVQGLGSVQLSEILAALDGDVREDGLELDRDWVVVEAELRRFVSTREEALLPRLELLERDLARKLGEEYESELTSRQIDAEEVPAEWEWGSRKFLQAAQARLAARESELRESVAQIGFERDVTLSETLCERRAYADARGVWEESEDDPWRVSVRDAVQLRLRECKLLERLVERAAAGVTALHRKAYAPRFEGIAHEGEVRAGPDPLARGFELLRKSGVPTERILLAPPAPPALDAEWSGLVLEAADLEHLAGLDDRNPEDRLVQALFRYYEGDFAGAQLALPLGRMPDDMLLQDLRARIVRALSEREEAVRDRRQRLRARVLNVRHLSDPNIGSTPTRILHEIDEILREFGDLLNDADRRYLERRRAEVVAPEETLEDVYAPDVLTADGPLEVSLEWTFASGEPGAWIVGEPWLVDAGELWLTERVTDDATLLSGLAPRLPLRAPLDLDRELTLRLELEELPHEAAHALENALVVSFAGYHFLFHDDPDGPRLFVGEGLDPSALLTLSRDAKGRRKGIPFKGFEPGKRRVIEITARRQQHNVEVLLDGARLERFPGMRPEDAPDLVLRSEIPVRVVRCVIEGRKLPRPR